MDTFVRTHLTDHSLECRVDSDHAAEHTATASALATLGEYDARKLYVPAAYDSMLAYCVARLGMSRSAAFCRIEVARAGRRFPGLFRALAEGRLNLTGALLLSRHLTPETAEALLAAAANKSKDEIRLLIAERFPRPDVPTVVREIPGSISSEAIDVGLTTPQLVLERVVTAESPKSPTRMGPLPPRARVEPLSGERYEWHLTVDRKTQELLQHVQTMLGHAVPSGDVPEVLKRALGLFARALEKQKYGKVDHPRTQRSDPKGRHIPAEVRRAVFERDGRQCTFESDQGHRCQARANLELDHIEPVARGGRSTIGNLRVRCRAHNHYAAEQVFGHEFMRQVREMAEQSRAEQAQAVAIAGGSASYAARSSGESSSRAPASNP